MFMLISLYIMLPNPLVYIFGSETNTLPSVYCAIFDPFRFDLRKRYIKLVLYFIIKSQIQYVQEINC